MPGSGPFDENKKENVMQWQTKLHTGETLTELDRAVMNAEIKAGIRRSPSSDTETAAELSQAQKVG